MAAGRIKQLARRAINAVDRVRARWKNELTIHYDGLTLRYATESPVAKRWFYPRYIDGRRVHEPPISSLIRSELGPNSIFFDVGANVGFFTVLGANVCTGPEGEVHAFELEPELIPLIDASVRLNETGAQLQVNCAACANGTGAFYSFHEAQKGNASTNQINRDANRRTGGVQVMSTTLDHYWRKSGASPDLVKMDIEGAEALAVPGMLELLRDVTPKLILETHPSRVRQLGTAPASLVERIQEAGGYRDVQRIADHRSPLDRGPAFVPLEDKYLQNDRPVVLYFSP
jgi:FkbM family methyltransferase